jgi:hypothetical protein
LWLIQIFEERLQLTETDLQEDFNDGTLLDHSGHNSYEFVAANRTLASSHNQPEADRQENFIEDALFCVVVCIITLSVRVIQ